MKFLIDSFLTGIMMQILTSLPAYVICALLVMQQHSVSSEMFSALADMEGLVSTEFELVKQLDNYIQEEETRLKQLRG